MKRALLDWAGIAEIVSSVAVVVTLVFLIVGIRQNTEITRAAAFDRNIDSLNETRGWIVNDPELAKAFREFTNDDAAGMDEPALTRLNLLMNSMFGVYEKAYFAYQRGYIALSEWSRFDKQICVQYDHMMKGPSLLIESLGRASTEEFMGYIEATCGIEAAQE